MQYCADSEDDDANDIEDYDKNGFNQIINYDKVSFDISTICKRQNSY